MRVVSITVSRKKGHGKAGDCIMPREGVFARVTVGGKIRFGD